MQKTCNALYSTGPLVNEEKELGTKETNEVIKMNTHYGFKRYFNSNSKIKRPCGTLPQMIISTTQLLCLRIRNHSRTVDGKIVGATETGNLL